ncbi:MAG: LD-carboxypeptidase [Sphingomonadaceae bacterium]
MGKGAAFQWRTGLGKRLRIAIVAPSSRIDEKLPDEARAAARALYGDAAPELFFHRQCFASSGHFAGDDAARAAALAEVANDPLFDAVWFARGGYGSCRIAERAVGALDGEARAKTFLGYSDGGSMLAALYRAGHERLFHGPVVADLRREGGAAAFARALAWFVGRDRAALEPSVEPGTRYAAFNLTILSQLLGTPLEPDLAGHVLMLEEVSEYMYRIDRAFFHVTSNANIRKVAGIRLGRCSLVPENDPDFGQDEEEVARHWCERSGIPFLGRADIGHDAANRIVPFGELALPAASPRL